MSIAEVRQSQGCCSKCVYRTHQAIAQNQKVLLIVSIALLALAVLALVLALVIQAGGSLFIPIYGTTLGVGSLTLLLRWMFKHIPKSELQTDALGGARVKFDKTTVRKVLELHQEKSGQQGRQLQTEIANPIALPSAPPIEGITEQVTKVAFESSVTEEVVKPIIELSAKPASDPAEGSPVTLSLTTTISDSPPPPYNADLPGIFTHSVPPPPFSEPGPAQVVFAKVATVPLAPVTPSGQPFKFGAPTPLAFIPKMKDPVYTNSLRKLIGPWMLGKDDKKEKYDEIMDANFKLVLERERAKLAPENRDDFYPTNEQLFAPLSKLAPCKIESSSDAKPGQMQMEEAILVHTIPNIGSLFIVSDGYGGIETAKLVTQFFKKEFLDYLEISEGKVYRAFELLVFTCNQDILQSYLGDKVHGATASIIFIPLGLNMAYCAAIGDVHAVIYRKFPNRSRVLEIKPIPLALRRNWSDPVEQNRARDKGKEVMDNEDEQPRVDGLSISRSFGNKPFAEKGLITAEPTITRFSIRSGDEIVIGSKGLFSYISLMRIAGLLNRAKLSQSSPAHLLVSTIHRKKEEGGYGSKYNASAIVINVNSGSS